MLRKLCSIVSTSDGGKDLLEMLLSDGSASSVQLELCSTERTTNSSGPIWCFFRPSLTKNEPMEHWSGCRRICVSAEHLINSHQVEPSVAFTSSVSFVGWISCLLLAVWSYTITASTLDGSSSVTFPEESNSIESLSVRLSSITRKYGSLGAAVHVNGIRKMALTVEHNGHN